MKNRWNNYSKEMIYANEIVFENAIDKIEEVLDSIEGVK